MTKVKLYECARCGYIHYTTDKAQTKPKGKGKDKTSPNTEESKS